MDDKLKPCPFCEKNVAVITNAKDLEECLNFEYDNCHCDEYEAISCVYNTVVCSVNKGGCGASSGYYPTIEQAIEAWNRRAVMAEYIEREALKKIFIDHYADEYPTSLILAVIDNVSAADVEEVRHGKWYRHNEKEHGDTCYYCSYCEEIALSDCMVWELTDYCPNCGAKMDLGDD